jgi:spermidine synthase
MLSIARCQMPDARCQMPDAKQCGVTRHHGQTTATSRCFGSALGILAGDCPCRSHNLSMTTIAAAHPRRPDNRLLWMLFFASGFAGLIYESIWTHYLKLFLGHAAYAQTLVLAIFMGGMATGSALAARYSSRLSNPLRSYALIEALIGGCALVFHPTFELATGSFYGAALGEYLGPSGFTLAKWSLAALLILPQSMLLGATFPLFAAAATRSSKLPGGVIAILYFANSLGGALGVLLSGFLLIPAFGLPGTMMTVGLLNLLIATLAWRFAPQGADCPAQPTSQAGQLGRTGWFLLGASFLTGASSFIYEAGWIRMLSLVLGSATHAFELMLSAFITGLAFGGLWIRKRIDRGATPGILLGYIQLAMGCAAIATLPLHNLSFDLIAWLVKTAPKTEDGYTLFNLVRYGVAALIMFPAAFCAGMTLPLATRILYARPGQQERAIGLIYSANTIGAIVGLTFAVFIGLPYIGLNYLIASGAMVDVLLGAALLVVFGSAQKLRLAMATALTCALATVATAATFNPQKLVSGVFRTGQAKTEGSAIEIAHGRTATISTEINEGAVFIRTNGKPDASAYPGTPSQYRMDEVTMTLLGAIPLMLHRQPSAVANIGFGSGITGETLLSDPRVKQLDSIEIEPKMVEMARRFTGRNERMYNDPRSHIHIDDAKAYFAATGKRYDLIVSEPSNPWVSGVSGLFSREFYRHVIRYMAKDGLFAQWLQVYESHPDRVASVLKAISEEFDDYLVVAVDFGDLLIIARPQGKIEAGTDDFNRLSAETKAALWRLDVANQTDITLRILGNKALFKPWLDQKTVPANSDYFPYIDTHADQDRFIGASAQFQGIGLSAYPIPELLGMRPALTTPSRASLNQHFGTRPPSVYGRLLGESLLPADPSIARPIPDTLPPEWQQQARQLMTDCTNPPYGDKPYAISGILIKVLPYLSPSEGQALISSLAQANCLTDLRDSEKPWLSLLNAVVKRSAPDIATTASQLLNGGQGVTTVRARYLLGMAMLGHLGSGHPEKSLTIWNAHARRTLGDQPPGIELEILHANALAGKTNITGIEAKLAK